MVSAERKYLSRFLPKSKGEEESEASLADVGVGGSRLRVARIQVNSLNIIHVASTTISQLLSTLEHMSSKSVER